MLPTLWIHTRTLIYQLTLNGKFSISKNFLTLIHSLIIFLFDMCNLQNCSSNIKNDKNISIRLYIFIVF